MEEQKQHILALLASADLKNVKLARALADSQELDFPWEGLLQLAAWDKIKGEEDEQLMQLFQKKSIEWEFHKFERLPQAVILLEQLYRIKIRRSALKALPEGLSTLPKLEWIDFDYNQLNFLPKDFTAISKLKYLYLSKNRLGELPKTIGDLFNLEKLKLEDNQLQALPESVAGLKQLTDLDLSFNAFSIFPKALQGCSALRRLDLSYNPLIALPKDFGYCFPELRWLNLNGTALRALPESMGELSNLRKCYLKGAPLGEEERQKLRRLLPKTKLRFVDLHH